MKRLTFEDKPTYRIVGARVPHGVNPEIVVSIQAGGYIGLREKGRRKQYDLCVGELYVNAIISEIRANKKQKTKTHRK